MKYSTVPGSHIGLDSQRVNFVQLRLNDTSVYVFAELCMRLCEIKRVPVDRVLLGQPVEHAEQQFIKTEQNISRCLSSKVTWPHVNFENNYSSFT